ncbi:Hypoxanthine-guanine phosphoribosyltransferase [compost metagenome]
MNRSINDAKMNKIEVDGKNFELFLENETIAKRTRLIGVQLNVDYENRCPVLIGVLNGSFVFMADLLKEIEIACEISFVRVASYDGSVSSGQVREVFGLSDGLKDRDVLLIEDIVDSGLTLSYLLEKVKAQSPASIAVCTLLFKPSAVKTDIPDIRYVGFEIPNDFVIGYGLDYNELGRNLKDVYRAI